MELIYLWISGYKNIKNAGFILNSAYEDNSIEKEDNDNAIKHINLIEKENYANIFGKNLNIITIVGENGSGKSNVINILSYILRSISSVKNKKMVNGDDYDIGDIPNDCKYCLIIKENEQYIAFCSDNCINKLNAEIKTKEGKNFLKAVYFDSIHALNKKIPFIKKRIVQSENHKYKVAKFQPFYKKEDSNPVQFTLWNSIDNITRIKLKNYFYYDRFRLYDTVRNLMALYEFNNEKQLNIFKNNKKLIFDKYSPYVDIVEALKWANDRIQNTKEESYEITRAISGSAGQLTRQMNAGKTIEYVLDKVLPKLFFMYALGEILEINKNKKYKDDNRKMIIAPFNEEKIKKLDYETYDNSSKRVEFYEQCLAKCGNKRLKDMFSAYIKYETNSQMKKYLTNYYILKGNVLKLKTSAPYADKNKKYIKSIESLKAISKNLYMSEEYDFMSLSTGEQRLMRFIADLYYCADKLKGNSETNIFLFDEMDLSWHPEWQRKMIYYVYDLLKKITMSDKNKNRKFSLIFTTHSPFILSDMPQGNVVFLDKGNNITKTVNLNTFGANIHDLFNCGFFFEYESCCTMGKFVQDLIQEDILNGIENLNESIQEDLEYKINLIGDPLLRNALLEKLYFKDEYKPEIESIEYLRVKNKKLQQRIDELEKEKNNEKN